MFIYIVFRVEFEFDIRFCVAPQKPEKNSETHKFRTYFFLTGPSGAQFFLGDALSGGNFFLMGGRLEPIRQFCFWRAAGRSRFVFQFLRLQPPRREPRPPGPRGGGSHKKLPAGRRPRQSVRARPRPSVRVRPSVHVRPRPAETPKKTVL